MKIGITGASGFLGKAIIASANDRDWEVVAYSRRAKKKIFGASEIRSLADPEAIDLSGLDALVHLAGEPIFGFWSKEKKRKIRASRSEGTRALVEALEQLPSARRPSVFVSASAIGYYGDGKEELLDEDSDLGFGFISEVCRDWEAASAGAKRLGVRVVNPRIGLVLGEDGFLKNLRTVFKLGLGGKLGSGQQWMSWIHIDDVVSIFCEAIENGGIRGALNCVAPNPVRNQEFTAVYAEVLNRKAILPVPAFFLNRLPGGLGRLFLDSQRVEPLVLKAYDYDWEYPDLRPALEAVESDS